MVRRGLTSRELKKLIERNKVKPIQLQSELDVSESTIRRWLGDNAPLSTVASYAVNAAIASIVREMKK